MLLRSCSSRSDSLLRLIIIVRRQGKSFHEICPELYICFQGNFLRASARRFKKRAERVFEKGAVYGAECFAVRLAGAETPANSVMPEVLRSRIVTEGVSGRPLTKLL